MFPRPENEISDSILFVFGFLFCLIFNFTILFLIYEVISVKERNSSFNTQFDSSHVKLFV